MKRPVMPKGCVSGYDWGQHSASSILFAVWLSIMILLLTVTLFSEKAYSCITFHNFS